MGGSWWLWTIVRLSCSPPVTTRRPCLYQVPRISRRSWAEIHGLRMCAFCEYIGSGNDISCHVSFCGLLLLCRVDRRGLLLSRYDYACKQYLVLDWHQSAA